MKTELKDVLHFYLGAPVSWRYEDDTVEGGSYTGWQTMSPVILSRILGDKSITDVKIKCRRLSSMTENEKIEFKEIIPWIDFQKFLPGDQWQYYEHAEVSKHETRPICLTTAGIKTLPLCVGNWCRKNSFDIDGLIDSSQAIEQTP